MTIASPEENPIYARARDLHPLHWETLSRRDPEEAARAAGARWDGEAFLLPFLGRALRVVPGSRDLGFQGEPGDVGYQRALVAVAYLARAVDVPLRGEWVSFRELPGGAGFFRGPHGLATAKLESTFGADPGRLVEAGRALGGVPVAAADAAVEFPALPKVPLRALLWKGTDEFPPSAQLLTDARASLHLALDVLWALANVAISDLGRAAP